MAYYCNGDVVVAVATMGMDPVMAKVATLMRGGKVVGRDWTRPIVPLPLFYLLVLLFISSCSVVVFVVR